MPKEQEMLLVAAYQTHCEVLGPGKRFVLWVQGCPFSCPGCIAESMRSPEGGQLYSVAEMAELIVSTPDIEGITVSGGEPFLQAAELALLFEKIRRQRDLGIIVYTGFKYEQLVCMQKNFSEIGDILKYIDMLIDGPYIQAENSGFGWKGSSNQKNHLFTERYRQALYLYEDTTKRKVEMYPGTEGTFMAGVPSKAMAQQWREQRRKQR